VSSGDVFVFPAKGLQAPKPTTQPYTADNVLRSADSHFKGGRYNLGNGIAVDVTRIPNATGKNTSLKFDVKPDPIESLQSWSWDEFRNVQWKFKQGLFGRTTNSARPSASSFEYEFDKERLNVALRGFWLQCLTYSEARIAMRLARWAPDLKRKRSDSVRTDSVPFDYGPTMGAIPLQHGMRLRIYWGGTAVYDYGGPANQIVRQTITGTTDLDVVCRNGSTVLSLPPFADFLPPGESGQWAIASIAPLSAIGTNNYLPFGKATDLKGRRLVPVYTYLDFLHLDALQVVIPDRPQASAAPVNPPPPIATKPAVTNPIDLAHNPAVDSRTLPAHLTLLVPSSYTKSDLGRTPGDPYKPTTPETSDARESIDPGIVANEALASLSRRYILWGSKSPFTDPETNAPYLVGPTNDNWAYAPLAFGNQTAIAVQLPVNIGEAPATYYRLGSTWRDVLESEYRPRIAPGPSGFTLLRAASGNDDSNGKPAERQIFHAHCLPIDALEHLEIFPGDQILLQRN
jgi:hypothetical protein